MIAARMQQSYHHNWSVYVHALLGSMKRVVMCFFLVEQNGYSSFNTATTHEKCTQILARI